MLLTICGRIDSVAIFRDDNLIECDRSTEDRRRHRVLVEDSIKKNIVDILSEESIIGVHKNKKVKIPIKALKEYSFIYNKNKGGVVTGIGNRKENRGDIIEGKEEFGSGDGSSAGNNESEDMYESEMTIENIVQYIFEELHLPNSNRNKYYGAIASEKPKIVGFKNHGIATRLAKKRTVVEKLKRRQGMKKNIKEKLQTGEFNYTADVKRFPFKKEDLRYFNIKTMEKKNCRAVVIFIMDTSASMDKNKKYLARAFFFMINQFVKMKHSQVEVVFIAHSTTSKVVNEYEFFNKVESGGTYISSGYYKAIEVINAKYDPSLWNIYSFHVSDGDNWSEDNEKALKGAKSLCELSDIFAYNEIMAYDYVSTTRNLLSRLKDSENFIAVTMKSKEDLWRTLKSILSPIKKNN